MEDDDFTFPTVAAAPEAEGQQHGHDGGPVQLPLPDLAPAAAAAAAPPLWPFAASPRTTESRSSGRAEHRAEAEAQEEEEERRVAADEERMDLLWEGAAATAPASRSGGERAEPPERRALSNEEEEVRAAKAAAHNERMDLLWESFNEELLLRRARSKAAAAAGDRRCGAARPGLEPDWYLCHYSPSDAESEETSASSPRRPGYGCAPTMLRASSRAGGAGQFCSSPRRRTRGRGAAAGWALLLRLFRRLFAVEKTASRCHGGIYVP